MKFLVFSSYFILFVLACTVGGDQYKDMIEAIKSFFSDPEILKMLEQYGPVPAPTPAPAPTPTPSYPAPTDKSPPVNKVWGSQPSIAYQQSPEPSYQPSPAPSYQPSPAPSYQPSPAPTPAPTPTPYPAPKPESPKEAPKAAPAPTPTKTSGLIYTGVNQAGADFGETNLPGKYGSDYAYPEPDGSTAFFVGLGMNLMRMPFRLERLVPDAINFDETEWGRFKASVSAMKAAGSKVLLDPHNYFKFFGANIGAGKMSSDQYAAVMEKLAIEYKGDDSVMIGLMNEPHTVDSETVMDAFSKAIKAIRGCGADNIIVVSGNAWDNAKNWFQDWYGTSNAVTIPKLLKSFNDPNIKVEVHTYYDADGSGTTPNCVSDTIGSETLSPVTDWLKENNIKGLLTEFGAGDSCAKTLEDTLKHISDHTDAWEGYTYWAAGPMWGDYIFSVDPKSPDPKPQLPVLEKYC